MVTYRMNQLVLQAEVEPSECLSMNFATSLTYLWAGTQTTIDSSGDTTTTTLDLAAIASANIITSAVLVISSGTLTAGTVYTFAITTAYAASASSGSSTSTVEVTVARADIIVGVLGGSRTVPKSSFIAIDAGGSSDPDYPSAALTSDWTFSYSCAKSDGTPCS